MSTRVDESQIERLLGQAKQRGSALRLRRRRATEVAVVLIAVCGSLAWGGPSLGATAPGKAVAIATPHHGAATVSRSESVRTAVRIIDGTL